MSARLEIEENGWEGMGRVLTIQIEITDQEKASWIWDNHMGKDTGNGVIVQAIQNGKIPTEKEDADN